MGRRYAKPGRVLHDLGPAALIWESVDLFRECVGQSRRHGCPHDNGLLFESRLHSVRPPCRRSLLEPLLDSTKPDFLRAIRQWSIQRILRRRSRLPEHYGLDRFSAQRAVSRKCGFNAQLSKLSTRISLDGLARFACQCTDFPPRALSQEGMSWPGGVR